MQVKFKINCTIVYKQTYFRVAQWVEYWTCNLSVFSLNLIKGSHCFLEQNILPSLLSTLRLHYNTVVGVHMKKKRGRYSSLTRPLSQVFHVPKQMLHPPSFGMGHQSLYFNGYNTQTINKLRYMYQLSIGVCWSNK